MLKIGLSRFSDGVAVRHGATHQALRRGRMTGITTPAGVVSYGYNPAGEQTSMVQPEGTVTTSYDQNGFVAGVSDWRGDSIVMTNDADVRMLNAESSNGVDTNYWYDTAGRLTGVDHLNAAGPIDGFQYMLDGNGNRTMVASNAGSESYTLDALNRVTNASYPGGLTETFVYDDAGNRTSHTKTDGTTVGYTVDATGQLVSDSTGTTYTYDDAGNLTSTSDGDTYTYDDYGRTTAVTSNGVTATFGYDAANVRVSVNGEAQLWDRNGGLPNLISTSTGDNYVHTAGVARDGDDWLLADAVGSIRATVDQTGATVGAQDFTVFGEQLSGTGSFGFAGEQQDPTGQLHLRARQYNPGLGRFTSVDPVQPGAPGTTGYNLYAYSGNNPTTWGDPSGRQLGDTAIVNSEVAVRTSSSAGNTGALVVGAVLLTLYSVGECAAETVDAFAGEFLPGPCSFFDFDGEDEELDLLHYQDEQTDEEQEVDWPEPELDCSDVYPDVVRERLATVASADSYRISRRQLTVGRAGTMRNQTVAVLATCNPTTLQTEWFSAAQHSLSPEQSAFSQQIGITPVDDGSNDHAERKVLTRSSQVNERLAIGTSNNFCGPEKADCRSFLATTGAIELPAFPRDHQSESKRAIWPAKP